jgi:hypothetical protein
MEIILFIIVAVGFAISQAVINTNVNSLKKAYKGVAEKLGNGVELRSKFSKNSGNETFYIKGRFREDFELEINNYFDASSTTQSKTFIYLKDNKTHNFTRLFLIPAKNRQNSSLGGTKFIDLYAASDQFNRQFALATDDEAFTQLLFSEARLIESIENTPLLREGFLIVESGKIQFTLQRNLRLKGDPELIIDLLTFMSWLFEFFEEYNAN